MAVSADGEDRVMTSPNGPFTKGCRKSVRMAGVFISPGPVPCLRAHPFSLAVWTFSPRHHVDQQKSRGSQLLECRDLRRRPLCCSQ